ncbi:MAG TPA: hypothetical protein VF170_18550, partial [Planctomycetaceae bacterium]
DPAAEPLPVIVPAGHEEPSKAPEAEATAPPAEPAADFSDFGPNPFGPDPFGDAAPLTPDPAAAGLEEPAPAPAEQPSPSDLLDGDDPFADAPSDAADATSPEASEPTPPASEPESPFAVPPAEGPSVPVDGGEPPAETPPAAVPAADDPFADAPATEPAPAAEPAPAGEPATGDPFGEPTTDDPFGDVPASDPFPAADPGDDPFGDAAPPAEPAEPPAAAPQEPAAAEPSPVPAEEPTPGPGTEADDPFPASPDEPATESPFGDPGAEPTPLPGVSTPGEEHPRLLPMDDEEDMRGVGTVTPDAPRGSQRAELSVEKKAPEQAVLGQPLVYEIVVTNVGDSPAHEVTVSDVIPKGTELQGSIPRAEMAGKMLVWRLETLAPGKSKSIKVKVLPIEAGPVGSVATVTFVSEIAAETKVVAPHLTLKVDAPEQVALGQPVDFRFEIANEGTAPAEKVLLRDLLPEGFKHSDGNDLEYEVGTLPPGKAEAVTLRVAAVKPGSYTNKAVVTAAGGLKTEAAAAVEIADQRVSVTRRGPARRYVGRPAMYHNVVRNASDRPVRGVKVVEQVPPGMEFVNASHGGQFDPDQRTVAWQIASLQPGQEQTLQVVLTAAAEGVQDSVVRVEETSGGTVELASSTAVQGVPSLAPTMQGPDRPVAVGERAAFRIRVRNRGNADAT